MTGKLSNLEYLLAKGLLDALLAQHLITLKEYEEIDALNKGKE